MTSRDQNISTHSPVYPVAHREEPAAGDPAGLRPHVYLLCDRNGWDRIGPIVRRLAVGLADGAIRVSLICDYDCGPDVTLPGLQGSYNLRQPGLFNLFGSRRRFDDLKRFARRGPPTCIHAISLSSIETAEQMRRTLSVPLVVGADSLDEPQINLLADLLCDQCRAVAMSTPIQQMLLNRLKGDPTRAAFIHLVRPAVHVQERAHPSFEPGSPVSLLVLEPAARMDDMEIMMQAIAHLLRNGINAMLFFIDSGPGEPHLRKLAARLQIAEHTTFTGKFTRWPQTLGAADVLLLPQPHKQMRIYPLEAMAGGTLIVAAAGHCYDTILDGKTGLEFQPHNQRDLTDRLLQTLQDPHQARSLAYAAQEKIRRDHTASHMITAYMNLYKNLSTPQPPSNA